jgi:peptidoglycan/LPS O-acetylase OafA/YrhL
VAARKYYPILDGLRGVAALVVLIFHIVQQQSLTALPFAPLAVDFFYVLSGFVVASAYEHKIAEGMGVGAFMKIRFQRLYPLTLLGVMMGFAMALLSSVVAGTPPLLKVAEAGALAALLLPSYVFPQWESAYPLNMAAWSLSFEFAVNFAYVLVAGLLVGRRMVLFLIASAASLLLLVLFKGTFLYGNNQDGFLYGFFRVTYPFFAGVLLYRLQAARPPPERRLGWALMALLVLCLAWPVAYQHAWTSLALAVVVFPVIVWFGASSPASGALAKVCRLGGLLSFPVYILQAPLIRLGSEVVERLGLEGAAFVAFAALEFAVCVLAAIVAVKIFDEPLQAAFKRRNARLSASAPA